MIVSSDKSSTEKLIWMDFRLRLVLAYAESYGFLGIAIVAPPPNLLLNSDILKPSTLYWKINRKIKPVNLKLFKPFTVLTSF